MYFRGYKPVEVMVVVVGPAGVALNAAEKLANHKDKRQENYKHGVLHRCHWPWSLSHSSASSFSRRNERRF